MFRACRSFVFLFALLPFWAAAEDWSVSYKFEPTIIPNFPPSGDWSNASNWNPDICTLRDATSNCLALGYPGQVPADATETVFWQITVGNTEPFGPATLNLSGLSVSPVGSLTIQDDVILNAGGTLGMNQQKWDGDNAVWIWEQAELTNNGVINLFGTINSNGGDLLIKGLGKIVMNSGSSMIDVPDNPTEANDPGLRNQTTIEGLGTIRATAGFHNQGVVNANDSFGTMVVNYFQPPSGPSDNSGTLRASGGGTLRLQGNVVQTLLDNAGGRIEALDGSSVELRNMLIENGTLSTAGTGIIEVQSYGVGIADLTNEGLLQVNSGQKLVLAAGEAGIITNNGTIRSVSSGFVNTIIAPTSVRVDGIGSIQLTNETRSLIEGGAHLINGADHTIEGQGRIWNNAYVTNEGLVDANISSGRLRVQPQLGGQLFNTGLMRASNGGILDISATDFSNFGNVDNTDGVILAADGSSVELKYVRVMGGTLTTSGSGVVRTMTGGNVELQGLTNLGMLDIGSGTVFNAGIITNDGSMTLGSGSTGRSLSLAVNATVTLDGSGSLAMSNSASNQVASGGGLATTLVNGATHTIRGAGGIGTSFVLGVVNNGLILADQATPLTVTSGSLSSMTNNGTLRAAAGSTLTVAGTLTNFNGANGTLTGGTYEAAGTMRLPTAGGIIRNGAEIILDGAGSNLYTGSSGTVLALADFAVNQATGRFELRGGRDFATAGDLTNAGGVQIGVGSLMFTTNAGSYHQTGGSTVVDGVLSAGGGLLLDGGTLGGSGSILGNLVNNGVVAPGNSPGTLAITGDYTQGGTLQIEIASDAHDQLAVSGTAILGGVLEVALLGGPTFMPSIGQVFDILSATVVSGQFATTYLPMLGAGSDWNVQYLTDAFGDTDVVRLQVVAAAVPAPAAAWLLASGIGVLLARRRNRRVPV